MTAWALDRHGQDPLVALSFGTRARRRAAPATALAGEMLAVAPPRGNALAAGDGR